MSRTQRFQLGAQSSCYIYVDAIFVLFVQLYQLVGEYMLATEERMMGERDANDFQFKYVALARVDVHRV